MKTTDKTLVRELPLPYSFETGTVEGLWTIEAMVKEMPPKDNDPDGCKSYIYGIPKFDFWEEINGNATFGVVKDMIWDYVPENVIVFERALGEHNASSYQD
jgi:hypothetical protein